MKHYSTGLLSVNRIAKIQQDIIHNQSLLGMLLLLENMCSLGTSWLNVEIRTFLSIRCGRFL